MKYTTLALALLGATALADDFTVECDGNQVPDYDDCQVLLDNLKASDDGTKYFPPKPNVCEYILPPAGTDSKSLNCVLKVCFNDGADKNAYYTPIGTDYTIIKDQCGGAKAGGQFNDQTLKYSVSAKLNPDFNPGSKKAKRTAARTSRAHPRELVARDGICTDGSGDYKLLVTSQNVEKPGTEKPVTGRLPNGSSYMIQTSDQTTIGVETSVSVEAGFFDLFSTTASVSVNAQTSETTTTGVTVNVDCESGQEGVIYIYPLYTEYKGLCTSDNNNEIDVYVPSSPQNNYMVQCLGSGSGST